MIKGRILLIEDEVDLARLFEYALTRRGHEILRAKDAEAGLKMFHRWNPDLILLDLVLPGMGGAGFLKQLRKTSKIKVILISGQRNMDARALGADYGLPKPFNLEELTACVALALRTSRPAPLRRRAEKAGRSV